MAFVATGDQRDALALPPVELDRVCRQCSACTNSASPRPGAGIADTERLASVTQLRWSSVSARRVASSRRGRQRIPYPVQLPVVVARSDRRKSPRHSRSPGRVQSENRRHEGFMGQIVAWGIRIFPTGKIVRGDLPHVFAGRSRFAAPFAIAGNDAKCCTLAANSDLKAALAGSALGLSGRLGVVRKNRARQPSAVREFHHRADLASQ